MSYTYTPVKSPVFTTSSTQFYTTNSSITGVHGKYHGRVMTEDLIKEIVDERVKEILTLIAERMGGEFEEAIKGVLETKDLIEKVDKGDIKDEKTNYNS
jgi:hypothetical protein